MKYPEALKKGDTIYVTAPSSGVPASLHGVLQQAVERIKTRGFHVRVGETAWMQHKAASADRFQRAEELMMALADPEIRVVMPPWGGERIVDILPLLEWEWLRELPPTWIIGYSDTSTLAFAYTMMTGTASAHGTNLFDLAAPIWDDTTKKWEQALKAPLEEAIYQHSSPYYQSSWDKAFEQPGSGFALDTRTSWKHLEGANTDELSGRLLGGCLNTLTRLVGTPLDRVQQWRSEKLIWYLESTGMDAAEIHRSLWQLQQAGWLDNAAGLIIGRPEGYSDTEDFTMEDSLRELFGGRLPVWYDADIGHMPPQWTFINGAFANLRFDRGEAEMTMRKA
ncbi:LD-carboxypeptidase [Marinococcus halophilus]|uniref:LD-carboxypeptidase n=1 Tax=Marinococcus halophilus TaxID=1371 RepID=A0A510Y584_MARHA|nr:S66 peptidase family protein [Marinococcus halophilus]OZT80438.1 LD-carboxypeptidase [Marinococcus halophilus]GEK58509.1 LD-carboxypeptidase [Marinococcus halophilus]